MIVDLGALHSGRVVGVLVAIDGPLEGEVYRLVDGENKLGRGEKCEVQLESEREGHSDQRISREHACIVHADGTFVIKALSDKNPTFVNDVQVEGIELGDGDTLKLGRTTLRFRSV
jgi:predicted component of type VI protein secretion system